MTSYRCEYFDSVLCFIKINSKAAHPYHVIQCQYGQLENYNFVTQAWRRQVDVMIQMLFTDGTYFKSKMIKKPNYYKNHFSPTEEKQELLETLHDVTILC